jgi:hypothetical protein
MPAPSASHIAHSAAPAIAACSRALLSPPSRGTCKRLIACAALTLRVPSTCARHARAERTVGRHGCLADGCVRAAGLDLRRDGTRLPSPCAQRRPEQRMGVVIGRMKAGGVAASVALLPS